MHNEIETPRPANPYVFTVKHKMPSLSTPEWINKNTIIALNSSTHQSAAVR